jgi:hypothetical protein
MVDKRKNRIKLLIIYTCVFLILVFFVLLLPKALSLLIERLPGLYKRHGGNSVFVNSFTRTYLVDNIIYVYKMFLELMF